MRAFQQVLIDHTAETPTTIAATKPCADDAVCEIWNPGAAARWSLLFSPAFGAFIHMRNWQALDQPERAAATGRWFHASLGMLVLQIFTSALNARLGTERCCCTQPA